MEKLNLYAVKSKKEDSLITCFFQVSDELAKKSFVGNFLSNCSRDMLEDVQLFLVSSGFDPSSLLFDSVNPSFICDGSEFINLFYGGDDVENSSNT